MVVVLRSVVALQICEVNARNGHELSLHTLLYLKLSKQLSPGSITLKENFIEFSSVQQFLLGLPN